MKRKGGRRNPLSKGQRTITARTIEALAADINNVTAAMLSIAQSYRVNDGDHLHDAAMMDVAMDELFKWSRCPVWPRAKRIELVRSGRGFGPVVGTIPKPVERIVILVPRQDVRRAAERDIVGLCRDPHDRRIFYVNAGIDSSAIRSISVEGTIWVNYGVVDQARNEAFQRFGAGSRYDLAEAISLLNWRT